MRTIKSSRFSIHDQCLRLTNHKSTYIKLYTLLKGQRSTLADIYSDINNKLNEIEQSQSDESKSADSNQNSSKEIEELKNIFLFLKKILKYDLCKLILNSSRIMAKLSKYSIHYAHNETRNMMISSNSSLTLSSSIVRTPSSNDHAKSTMTLSKIRNLVETACVFFVKFQSMMLSSFKYIENKNVPMGAMQIHNPANDNTNSNNPLTSNNQNNRNSTGEIKETLICRLCNEHIDADRFDEHIKSCAIAFKSDLKLKDINTAIANQIDEIKQHFASNVWPGDLQDATSIVLPILHVAILLRQAKAVDGSTPESLEELEDIELSLFQIPIAELEDEKMNIHDDDTTETKSSSRIRKRYQTVALTSTQLFFNRAIYMKSILLVQDKIKVSIALNGASNVLRSTRISGSDRVSEIVKITDFILLKKISAGAFARVFLAQMKKTGDIFAMKVTPKSSLKHKNEVSRIIIEKDIMLNFNNPYIVNFYYSIIGKNNLYLVMEYLPGGDLFSLLQGVGSFDETTARIYTLEILQALLYLRKNGIVHRDLKPDNLLISSSGHLRLADFGLSHLGLIDRQNTTTDTNEPTAATNSENTVSKLPPIMNSTPKSESSLQVNDSNNEDHNHQNQELVLESLEQQKHQQQQIIQPRKPQIASSCQTEIDVNSNNNTITFYNHSPSSYQLTDDESSGILANGVVGTPDYIAPEILMSNPHGFTADYWSLGCILFEFLVGIPPFHAATENETFKNILTGKMHPFEEQDEETDEEDVIEISSEAKDLILKLLEPDPSKRLGVNGVEEISDHPWFDEFRGQDVDKIEPPFKPQLNGIDDTQYFKQRYSFSGRDDEDIIEDIANEFDESKTNKDEEKERKNEKQESITKSKESDFDSDRISKKAKRVNKSIDLPSKASSLKRSNSSDNFTSFLENYSDSDSENDDDNSSDSSAELEVPDVKISSESANGQNEENAKDGQNKHFKWYQKDKKRKKSKRSKDDNDGVHPGSFSFNKKKSRNDSDVTSKNSKKRKSKKELMSQFQSVGIDQIMKKNEELSKTRTKKDQKVDGIVGKFVKSSSTSDLKVIDQGKEEEPTTLPSSLGNSLPQSPLLDSFGADSNSASTSASVQINKNEISSLQISSIDMSEVDEKASSAASSATSSATSSAATSPRQAPHPTPTAATSSESSHHHHHHHQSENFFKNLFKKNPKNEAEGPSSLPTSPQNKGKSSFKQSSDKSSSNKKTTFASAPEEDKKHSKKEKEKEKASKSSSSSSKKSSKKNSSSDKHPPNDLSSIPLPKNNASTNPNQPNTVFSNDDLIPKPRARTKKMLATKQFVLNTASIHIESHTKSKIAARRKNRDRRLSLIAEQST